jgi:aryl-alcohol dehydrogenase-like predicted oxidoreductase
MEIDSDMRGIQIGHDRPIIKPLGFGTWAWGDRVLWGYGPTRRIWGYKDNGFNEEDLKQCFDAILDAGVTFFDTAEAYGTGRSERILGNFIKHSEKKVFVATKFFPFPWRLRGNRLLNALKHSFTRLQIDHIDLYQIHYPTPPVPIETWLNAMADSVDAGLISYVGVSNFNTNQIKRAHAILAKRGIPLFSNQVKYNLLYRMPESNGLIDLCNDLNILVIAYSPLAKGMLTGKYGPENPPPGIRSWFMSRNKLAEIHTLTQVLRDVGENHDQKSPSQVALNWLICKGVLPIPGVKNISQANDNLGALGWRLSDEEVAYLDSASESISN